MKPSDFFLGVSEFFAVIIPGFVVTVAGVVLFSPTSTPLDPAPMDWAVLAVASYIAGQILFAIGAGWDPIYDCFRPTGDKELLKRIIEIRKRTLEKDWDQIDRYKWSRAVLSKEHPEGYMEVLRKEADSKLFRSLIVPLAVLSAFLFATKGATGGFIAAGLALVAFWRFRAQRFNATIAAYTHVITLFGLGKILPDPPQAAGGEGPPSERDRLKHSPGGSPPETS